MFGGVNEVKLLSTDLLGMRGDWHHLAGQLWAGRCSWQHSAALDLIRFSSHQRDRNFSPSRRQPQPSHIHFSISPPTRPHDSQPNRSSISRLDFFAQQSKKSQPSQNGSIQATRQARQGHPRPRPYRYEQTTNTSTRSLSLGGKGQEADSLMDSRLSWWCYPGSRRVHGRPDPFDHPQREGTRYETNPIPGSQAS